uniref:Uncharacterized protein n=1 Tax=Oryza brachyantha TaxID=4533 RepID=J3MC78_ORYBR
MATLVASCGGWGGGWRICLGSEAQLGRRMEAGWWPETVWTRRQSGQRGQLVVAAVVGDRSTVGDGDVQQRPEAWHVAAAVTAAVAANGCSARLRGRMRDEADGLFVWWSPRRLFSPFGPK